jgi:alpha-mannosidase
MIYTPAAGRGPFDQATQDVGRHEILLALVGHPGDWAEGHIPAQAARLNQPLRAFLTAAHPGALGKSFSLLSLNSDQVQIMAVKQAEDSNEIVIRFKELTGKPANGLLLHGATAITSAREVDAQERAIGDATITNGALGFDMKGFGLRAYAIKLAPPTATVPPVTSQSVPIAYNIDVVSSRAKRGDGAMDADGGAYPAEMFPQQLTREGVEFKLGPVADGAKNALAAHGQQLELPAGDFNRVHLLVAANGDASGKIKIGDTEQPLNVPNWTGFIGQWDNRVWDPANAGAYSEALVDAFKVEHSDPPIGLTPGFIKRTPVAWFATHHNTPQGDAYYEYSYLFQLSYDLPKGAKNLTLPDNPNIRVFAVSVSSQPAATPSSAPLYDTLADHQMGGAPIIPQADQTFADATRITLIPPLYYHPHDLHYTLDGSDPTAKSAVYDGPFLKADTANIAVRQIDAGGRQGPITRGVITIHDTTPPQLVSIVSDQANSLSLGFSEPLNAPTASDVNNYTIQPPDPVNKITLSPDGTVATLTFARPLVSGIPYTVALHGIKDTSPALNEMAPTTRPFNAENIVYSLASAKFPGQAVSTPVSGLPVHKKDAWTMNVFAMADAKPAHREILVGFGKAEDKSGGGARYLALFPEDIEFWHGGKNVKTNSPLDLGRWQMLTVTYNGDSIALYKDGEPIGKERAGLGSDADSIVNVGASDPWEHQNSFEGSIKDFTIRRGALSDREVKALFGQSKKAP